ncbi:MAG: hypothetical protein II403_00010 [Prevotella sp.]|jgi:hypothetical protein|nr:hypothetical protein [Prevotella sp.]MBQ2192303.1 hypothetical protein [Prevotella sp.]
MNKIFKLLGSSLMVAMALTACSPETFDGPDQNGIPSVTGVDIDMNVDQAVNEATFTVQNMPKGTYAFWTVDDKVYSTLSPMHWANSKAGTYAVELRLGNRNGFSQSSITKTFTFENTKVDFTQYISRISRTWRINHTEVGHMGCGEPGTDGSNWWSAQPEDKADWGVYDDRITFSEDGVYDYDPGEGGTVYVNYETSLFPEYNTNDGNDFMAPVERQTSIYNFDVDGDKVILKLGEGTLFPYLSKDKQYAEPVFTVVKLTNSEMVLLYEGEGITWRFMFTSKEDDAPKDFKGYKFDSDGNMLRDATWELSRYYAHGDGWEGYNAEDITYTNEGNKKFVVTLPYESNQRWQAQFQLQNLGGVSTVAGKNYDFSIKLKANQDLNSATVKLTDAADDTNFYFDEVIPLEGDAEYLLYKSNMEGKDIAAMHLVFDFGGCQAGTVVEISDMVLKDHAYDDGAGQPEEQGEEGGDKPVLTPFDFNDPGNMLKDAGWDLSRYYAHGDGWEGYNAEDITYTNEGNQKFVVTLPYESNQRWQAQFQLQNLTGVSTSADKTYDFSVKLKANQDLNSATVKLTDAADDTNFYFDEVIPLEGDSEYSLVMSGMPGKDIATMHLVFDFGGCAAGTEVEITDMVFKEHSDDGGSEGSSPMNYDDADNMWKAIDDNSAFELGYYFAAGDDWHAIDYTEATHTGNTYELTLPTDQGKNQWQGQFHIDTKLTASASKKYDFQFVIETDADCPQVTMKLTDAGDTNFFIEERNDVPEGSNVFSWTGVILKEGTDADAIRFFLDFGGCPGGTNVKISKIILREAK